ncbi:hypothetical protein D0Z08_22510 [Nocardioides immobilis]|uniref:Uncharacterized protein n=1 Tax=Nocardioides immobilis TaxID=2049295 RepID=A0A417XW70_9ACTN|nr:hypothetical protein D0Z08_22510 [Nocardioides immobilis]
MRADFCFGPRSASAASVCCRRRGIRTMSLITVMTAWTRMRAATGPSAEGEVVHQPVRGATSPDW